MSHFFKTELGQNALQQRHIALTARQRRLLLLIDHHDFQELDSDYREKIAPTELLQQLMDMGLLAQQTTPVAVSTPEVVVEIAPPVAIPVLEVNPAPTVTPVLEARLAVASLVVAIAPTPAAIAEAETPPLEKLAFVEIQQVMIQTLTTYCGLMAKPLIHTIQAIKTLQQLKACQMQWTTSLQESRIPPMQFNQTLKMINYSVQHL